MDESPRIRVKAICVFRRGDRVLVAHATDAVKGERYARPLGGSVELGESALDALRREIREEVGREIEDPRFLGVLENRFSLEGRPGHEILFVFDARLLPDVGPETDALPVHESGWEGPAVWVPLDRFRNGAIPLYPTGLLDLLASAPTVGAAPGRGGAPRVGGPGVVA